MIRSTRPPLARNSDGTVIRSYVGAPGRRRRGRAPRSERGTRRRAARPPAPGHDERDRTSAGHPPADLRAARDVPERGRDPRLPAGGDAVPRVGGRRPATGRGLCTTLGRSLARGSDPARRAGRLRRPREADQDGHISSPWIFSSTAGTPLDESKVAKRFRELVRAAGVPHCRPYDLRHSFASHLLAEGAPITYVAAQLGHRKPTTTLAFYAHWIPRGDKSHIDRLAAARLAVAPKMPAIPLDDTDAGKVWHQSGAISKNVELTDAEVPENWSRRRDLNPRPADYETRAGEEPALSSSACLRVSAPPSTHSPANRPRHSGTLATDALENTPLHGALSANQRKHGWVVPVIHGYFFRSRAVSVRA
jgi:hypothetical protein